ncbi:TPA: hypothetical protein I8P56_003675 [Salmonella enterica subsp. enterica serovar Napoli]|nr:hypothetical protein [Salmonella enterica subsp. enterica serovar Napoli]
MRTTVKITDILFDANPAVETTSGISQSVYINVGWSIDGLSLVGSGISELNTMKLDDKITLHCEASTKKMLQTARVDVDLLKVPCNELYDNRSLLNPKDMFSGMYAQTDIDNYAFPDFHGNLTDEQLLVHYMTSCQPSISGVAKISVHLFFSESEDDKWGPACKERTFKFLYSFTEPDGSKKEGEKQYLLSKR